MATLRPQDIWLEQCDAAKNISAKYGLKASFDYLVQEKLMNFAEAAANHPEFARELPRFTAEVRRMFSTRDMHEHLARIEREQTARTSMDLEEDGDAFPEDRGAAERWVARFELLKDLLTFPQLGTS
jgi:hypothetical protein